MKIIDTFMFYNELDMLYYRLSVLYDIIDYFVIVEATRTFAGNPKPLYYNENKHLFSKFSNKIIHIVDDELRPNICAWDNEHHQKNYIYEGIKQLNLDINDKIIIADVDEIPDINILKNIKDTKQNFNILHFEMDLYYYNLTCKYEQKWHLSKIVSYYAYTNIYNNNIKCCRDTPSEIGDGIISPGGWHLSYFGDPSFIRNKIEQFSHQELNDEKYKSEENILKQINNCNDLFMRDIFKITRIPIKENNYLPPQYDVYLKKFF